MPTLTINGQSIEVERGTSILRAAAMLGISIPHFCYHPSLSAPANCRMCLVEIEKARKLEPACYAKVGDGMVVHTESPKVIAARKAVLEFILINHPVDCPICDQAGECKLQDYYVAYDTEPSRLATPKVGKAKVHPIGPHVVYDGERCILCTRCVRFCDEVTGTSELTVVDRGDRSEIRTFPGRELDNAYSMNVTDICPVGALTTRDFRFKCRVWLMTSTDSVCVGCSRGCNVHMEHFQGEVQRYRPRFNPEVNEYWMCDAGRLSYKRLHQDRLSQLQIPGETDPTWPRAARALARLWRERVGTTGESCAFVLSAQASNEGLLAAKHFHGAFMPEATLHWSGLPEGDEDQFLVRRDKNPNMRGLMGIFGAGIATQRIESLLPALESGRVRALWMMGAALPLDAEQHDRFVQALAKVELFVLQSPYQGALAKRAGAHLPAATHAEYEGTFVSEGGLVQPFYRAFAPKGAALSDAEIFLRLGRGADLTLPFDSVDALQSQLYAEQAAQ